jgi:SAM-dependent methyltransferase
MVVNLLHKSKFLGAIFHTLDYCLQKELRDCETVLDLGCGPSSPIQYCQNVKRSVGVEPFAPYLEKAQKRQTHSEFLAKKIEELDFPERSFDAIMMIEVLEHLPKEEGLKIIEKARKWARKKVIISSPNGFLAQKEIDGNPWQKHLSGWDYREMKGLGFEIGGLAGWKWLRQENETEAMDNNILTSIRFRPKIFWFVVATISQLVIYYFPEKAFELFCVKEKK